MDYRQVREKTTPDYFPMLKECRQQYGDLRPRPSHLTPRLDGSSEHL